MIRHCSLWKFRTDAPADLADQITRAYGTVENEIPSVRAVQVGKNIGYLAANYDYALNLDFDDLDGYREYVKHPLHQKIWEDLLEPHVETRVGVQFELQE